MARTLAVDVKKLSAGAPGDGAAGTSLKVYDTIHESSLAFNFTEAAQTAFKRMGDEQPWAIINKAGDPSSIEFAIPSPTAQECADFMGGKVTGDKWEAPTSVPSIQMTVKIETADYQGKYYEYTLPLCSISARLSQAPGETQTELLLVKASIMQPISSAGVKTSPFVREEKTTTPG